MSIIADALERKKEQLPQFDYMWRVELPEITVHGMMDPTGAALLNTAVPALNILGGDGAIPGIERIINSANSTISGVQDTIGGYAQKSIDFARKAASNIPGYQSIESFFSGSNPLSGVLGSQAAISSLGKARAQGSSLSHRVFGVDMPYTAFEIEKHTYATTFVHTAANHEVGAMSMKIDEYEDGDTLRYLEAWRALIKNPDGTYNPPASYKRDIRFIKMASSGLDLHVTIYRGCFPSDIGTSSFSYDSSSITQYNVTFTGDIIEHIFIPANDVIRAVVAEQPSIMAGNGYGQGDFFSLSLGNLGSAALNYGINKVLDSQTARKLTKKVQDFFF